VVDNRSGGASQVGTQAIATAAPDGYTIGVIDSAFVINPGLFAGKLPYDTRKDFAPVSLLAMSPLVLVVHPDVPAILEHVRGGKVRALGITGARSAHMPDVPTMAETGLAGVDSAPLFGMVTPAAVPPAIVTRLSAAASRVVKSDALNQRLIEIGYLPVGSSAEEIRARIDAEIDKWTRIIQAANIKPT
jgi:tripartite-type tricarboxylate transporter receptor subunit TctC